MSWVFVLSSDRRPLTPCHAARARKLLAAGKAAVYRRYPFTLILKNRTATESVTRPHRLKIDPGAQTTGIAVVQQDTGRVVFAAELTHRGPQIRDALLKRRTTRRNRRQRKTRYRMARFLNRRRSDGWLAPSLQHRVLTTLTWVNRLRRWCSISAVSIELARFDTQLLQDAEIRGIQYQQGEVAGYEVREYLLQEWDRRCAYCDKAHWTDAVCVGVSTPGALDVRGVRVLLIRCTGHGTRQMCRMDRYGFPRTGPKQARRVHGFRTGDIVRAIVTTGKKIGTYIGRIAVRMSGSFNVTTATGTVQGISYRCCTRLQCNDGYIYAEGGAALPPQS